MLRAAVAGAPAVCPPMPADLDGPAVAPDLPEPAPVDGPSMVVVDDAPDGDDVAAPAARVASSAEPAAVPVDREWRLLAKLGDVRSVSFVGPVPLLVTGLVSGPPDTEALLHRLHGMSELVQMLVLTGDERVARWAEGLGPEASVVHW
jgi:hypothetical protein